jgi:hypothetical protein
LSGSAISVAKATTPSRPDWTSLMVWTSLIALAFWARCSTG